MPPSAQRACVRRSIVCFLGFLGVFLCEWGFSAPMHRFIYNSDGGNVFIDKTPPMKPEDVYSYVDEVVGTGVTSFFVSPNYGQPLLFPNETAGLIGSNATPTQEEEIQKLGVENRGSMERAILNVRGLLSQGNDPMGLILDRAKEKGLEAFLSLRMNEIHQVEEADSLLLDNFWREHPDWRVGKPGDAIGAVYQDIIGPRVHPIVGSWFWGALDYSIPEVRNHFLDQIRECCERYPQMDGLELDFQRFPVYFRTGEETINEHLMNQWLRDVRKAMDDIGAAQGRKILLSARILATPEQNLAIGLNPYVWAKEGLLDFVVVSHYLRNDFPLPVQKHRDRMPEGFPIYASIEVEPTPEDYRRVAQEVWAAQPDGVYLFNFFTVRERGQEPLFEILPALGQPPSQPSIQQPSTDGSQGRILELD